MTQQPTKKRRTLPNWAQNVVPKTPPKESKPSPVADINKPSITEPIPPEEPPAVVSMTKKPKQRANLVDIKQLEDEDLKAEREKFMSRIVSKKDDAKNSDEPVQLSTEQRRVMDLVIKERKSIFFTGPAGVGKSLLLREIIKAFKKTKLNVNVTASTGVAACNIGGTTLHAFAGIGLGNAPQEKLFWMIRKNKETLLRWTSCDVLIIDEISMIDGNFFDLLESLAVSIRWQPYEVKPFGGIQVVLCGDFFQLPPVSKDAKAPKKFCFEAECWNRVIKNTIKLEKIFRQTDPEFIEILNQLRINELSMKNLHKLKCLSRPLNYNDGIEPTELFPTRAQVENANIARLRNLPGQEKIFEASVWAKNNDQNLMKQINSSSNAVDSLTLRVGAQVMLLVNINLGLGLVNGCLGLVRQFDEVSGNPIVEFFPNIGGKTKESNALILKVSEHQWTIEERNEVIASKTQIPLQLAWAMSIHKSQGQTISRLKIDLGRAFEKGQVYVALSRGVSLEQLQIVNFRVSKVEVHEKVLEFNRKLQTMNDDAQDDDIV